MTQSQWDAIQKRLPLEDRVPYAEYFATLPESQRAQVRAAAAVTPPTPTPARTITTRNMGVTLPAEDLIEPVALGTGGAGGSKVPAGFTPGPLPADLQKFFGAEADVIGYQTVTNSDGTISVTVARSGGGTSGFGARLRKNPDGSYAVATASNIGGTTPAAPAAGTAAATAAPGITSAERRERQSIMDTLVARFNQYNLGTLANKIRELAIDGATEATITLALQETPEYKERFAANAERLKKNLRVLSPSEYLNAEDSYRQVLRAYGLKAFDTDEYVRQFIENDVSSAEFSERIVTAVQRVQNADPAIMRTLRDYYGIGNADLVAYVLDPQQQLTKIQRQVAAAEVGAAARRQGLEAGVSVAEQLAAQGITQAEAQRGYATIADILPTAEKLSAIYGDTMAGYGQAEAEQEVFNSLADAQRRREALVKREQAAFSGQAGLARTALTQENRGQF